LMTHPGVGPLTGLAYVLVIGTPDRFPCGKKIGSYTGLIPSEDSSAGHQRLGHISKQGNALLRYLLGEAAQAAARCNPDWRRRYRHLMMRREKRIAKVAMARKLAVRLYWMWRNHWQYSQLVEFGSNAGKLGTGHGAHSGAVQLMGHPDPSREGVRRNNYGRSFDQRDVSVELQPTARLRTSRGRRCRESNKTNGPR
jgi:hypothetical protein